MPRRLHTAADVWASISVGEPDECWLWQRSVSSGGYGQFYFDGRLHTAHRVAYELVKGPVPEGLQLDHLCRQRRCCNPSHLEPVTCVENIRRSPIHNGAKDTCPQGHEYAGDNLRVRSTDGARLCRECQNADSRERKRRKRARDRPEAASKPELLLTSCPGPRKTSY